MHLPLGRDPSPNANHLASSYALHRHPSKCYKDTSRDEQVSIILRYGIGRAFMNYYIIIYSL